MTLRPKRYTARWVLPVTAPPIRSGAVLVDEDGRIAEVGPANAVPAPEAAEPIELGNAILLPGLVNVHAHPELGAFRGLLEDLPFEAWLPGLMRIKREADPDPEDYIAAARWSCAEALASGITTLAATEDSGAALDALLDIGMRGVVYREVFGPAPEQVDDAMADLRLKVEAMRLRAGDRVRVGISPHAPYSVSDALFERVADYAVAEDLRVAVHAAEADAEMQLVRDGVGPFADGLGARAIPTPPRADSTIALLDRLGVLRTEPLLIHCVHVDARDIRRIVAAGATVAHCPAANARLGHGIAPVLEMLAAGVNVALGSDSVASNNRIDLLEEARLAQMFQRLRMHSADVLPPERLLRLATLDGARALGMDRRIGSLDPGKDADLCAISLAGIHAAPVHDPLATLFHGVRGPDIVLTAVRGRVLYRDGEFFSVDIDALRSRLLDAATRLGRVTDSAMQGG